MESRKSIAGTVVRVSSSFRMGNDRIAFVCIRMIMEGGEIQDVGSDTTSFPRPVVSDRLVDQEDRVILLTKEAIVHLPFLRHARDAPGVFVVFEHPERSRLQGAGKAELRCFLIESVHQVCFRSVPTAPTPRSFTAGGLACALGNVGYFDNIKPIGERDVISRREIDIIGGEITAIDPSGWIRVACSCHHRANGTLESALGACAAPSSVASSETALRHSLVLYLAHCSTQDSNMRHVGVGMKVEARDVFPVYLWGRLVGLAATVRSDLRIATVGENETAVPSSRCCGDDNMDGKYSHGHCRLMFVGDSGVIGTTQSGASDKLGAACYRTAQVFPDADRLTHTRWSIPIELRRSCLMHTAWLERAQAVVHRTVRFSCHRSPAPHALEGTCAGADSLCCASHSRFVAKCVDILRSFSTFPAPVSDSALSSAAAGIAHPSSQLHPQPSLSALNRGHSSLSSSGKRSKRAAEDGGVMMPMGAGGMSRIDANTRRDNMMRMLALPTRRFVHEEFLCDWNAQFFAVRSGHDADWLCSHLPQIYAIDAVIPRRVAIAPQGSRCRVEESSSAQDTPRGLIAYHTRIFDKIEHPPYSPNTDTYPFSDENARAGVRFTDGSSEGAGASAGAVVVCALSSSRAVLVADYGGFSGESFLLRCTVAVTTPSTRLCESVMKGAEYFNEQCSSADTLAGCTAANGAANDKKHEKCLSAERKTAQTRVNVELFIRGVDQPFVQSLQPLLSANSLGIVEAWLSSRSSAPTLFPAQPSSAAQSFQCALQFRQLPVIAMLRDPLCLYTICRQAQQTPPAGIVLLANAASTQLVGCGVVQDNLPIPSQVGEKRPRVEKCGSDSFLTIFPVEEEKKSDCSSNYPSGAKACSRIKPVHISGVESADVRRAILVGVRDALKSDFERPWRSVDKLFGAVVGLVVCKHLLADEYRQKQTAQPPAFRGDDSKTIEAGEDRKYTKSAADGGKCSLVLRDVRYPDKLTAYLPRAACEHVSTGMVVRVSEALLSLPQNRKKPYLQPLSDQSSVEVVGFPPTETEMKSILEKASRSPQPSRSTRSIVTPASTASSGLVRSSSGNHTSLRQCEFPQQQKQQHQYKQLPPFDPRWVETDESIVSAPELTSIARLSPPLTSATSSAASSMSLSLSGTRCLWRITGSVVHVRRILVTLRCAACGFTYRPKSSSKGIRKGISSGKRGQWEWQKPRQQRAAQAPIQLRPPDHTTTDPPLRSIAKDALDVPIGAYGACAQCQKQEALRRCCVDAGRCDREAVANLGESIPPWRSSAQVKMEGGGAVGTSIGSEEKKERWMLQPHWEMSAALDDGTGECSVHFEGAADCLCILSSCCGAYAHSSTSTSGCGREALTSFLGRVGAHLRQHGCFLYDAHQQQQQPHQQHELFQQQATRTTATVAHSSSDSFAASAQAWRGREGATGGNFVHDASTVGAAAAWTAARDFLEYMDYTTVFDLWVKIDFSSSASSSASLSFASGRDQAVAHIKLQEMNYERPYSTSFIKLPTRVANKVHLQCLNANELSARSTAYRLLSGLAGEKR